MKLPNKDIIATIENTLKDLEKEDADKIRAKISLALQNVKTQKNKLSKYERKIFASITI